MPLKWKSEVAITFRFSGKRKNIFAAVCIKLYKSEGVFRQFDTGDTLFVFSQQSLIELSPPTHFDYLLKM